MPLGAGSLPPPGYDWSSKVVESLIRNAACSRKKTKTKSHCPRRTDGILRKHYSQRRRVCGDPS